MKILVVCLGNICRSPLAEGILQAKLPAGFTVDSAGTIDMHEGKSPDERSVQTALNYHIDISKQKSRHFTASDFQEYDRIYVMDKNNLKDVLKLAKTEEERQKVSLIRGNNEEVPDPYWSEMPEFDRVYHLLDEACETIVEDVQAETNTQD